MSSVIIQPLYMVNSSSQCGTTFLGVYNIRTQIPYISSGFISWNTSTSQRQMVLLGCSNTICDDLEKGLATSVLLL